MAHFASMMTPVNDASHLQAGSTGFPSRLKLGQTSLSITTQPVTRTNKRASSALNYAEYDEDFDEEEEEIEDRENSLEQQLEKKPPKEEKRKMIPTARIKYSRQSMEEVANDDELLIPIRYSLDIDPTQRITDFFMWNVNEKVLTPEMFGKITCNDLGISIGYSTTIAHAIKTQVSEHIDAANMKLPPNAGLHVVINLSVNLDKQLFEDRFEWDLTGSELTPEQFAKSVVQDMGIAGEFYPAIAHALHEEIIKMKRELATDGRVPEFDNLAGLFKMAGWRNDHEELGESWAPTLEVLSAEEIEKREVERERIFRRQKRESARFGDDYGRKRNRIRYRYEDGVSRSGSPW